MAWGMANRPKASNKLGIPTPDEGSDGDMQVRQTNLGAKLFGKIGGRWHSTFLSREQEIVGTSGTAISMSSSGTLSVDEIELTGKITLASRGTQNICIGTGNADAGQNNVSIGVDAGKLLETGALNNTCIGSGAGKALTTEDANVFIGTGAGQGSTGENNVGIGKGVCQNLSSSDDNIFIGYGAGLGITTGLGNIGIGKISMLSVNISNGIAIGSAASVTGDYGIAIGLSTSAGEEVVTIGRSSDYVTLDFGDGDEDWSHTASDRRAKKDIIDNTLGLSFINDLKTVTFKRKPPSEYPEEFECYDAEKTERKTPDKVHYGFIAQDVKEAMDKAGLDKFPAWMVSEAGCQSIAKTVFITPLVKAVQELSAKIDAMQVEINNLT